LVGPDNATISLPPKSELIVGREDPISGIHPDVDMTAHGGEAGGVSRRHAMLRQQNGQWTVTDLDSTNYTRVDGNRVTPHTEVPIHDGSRIQFGRIEFVFHAQ
jgi:pSer/pThr/pTyr-binding forkhead associated (FHA) protein